MEEAGEALVVEDGGGRGEFDCESGVGGVEEGLSGGGGAGEEELGCAEGGEWLVEGETLVEEEADGEEGGARVASGYVEEVGAWRVENQGRDVVVVGGEASGEGGSDSGPVGDDVLSGEGAGSGEVLPGGVGVLGHALLAWAGRGAPAACTIDDGED